MEFVFEDIFNELVLAKNGQPPVSNLFKVVYEPDHSLNVLRELEREHQVDSMDVMRAACGLEPLPLHMDSLTLARWAHYLGIFLDTGGNLLALMSSGGPSDWSEKSEGQAPSLF